MEGAASTLGAILSTEASLSPSDAAQVTLFVSSLIEVQSSTREAVSQSAAQATGGSEGATEVAEAEAAADAAAESISRAVIELARAASASLPPLAGGNSTEGSGALVLESPNLNLTAEQRPATEIASRPVTIGTSASERPVEVLLPSDILSAAVGVNASLPVYVVLYTTASNLRGRGAAAALNATAHSSADDLVLAAAGVRESPTVTFSLMQDGVELRVSGADEPLNVSVPFAATLSNLSDGGRGTCLGTPNNRTELESCDSIVECRWWNSAIRSWSMAGCVTLLGTEGMYTCSCDHLTEFIVFEFPTTADEYAAILISSTSLNSLSTRALECAADLPSLWKKLPAVCGCILFLLAFLVFVLGNAVHQDRKEIRLVLSILQGKRGDEKKRARMRARRLLHLNGGTSSISSLVRRPTALLRQQTTALRRQPTFTLRRQRTTASSGQGEGPAKARCQSPFFGRSRSSASVHPAMPPDSGAVTAPVSAPSSSPSCPSPDIVQHVAMTDEPRPQAATTGADAEEAAAGFQVSDVDDINASSSVATAAVASSQHLVQSSTSESVLGALTSTSRKGPSALSRWKSAKHVSDAAIVTERWHKDVDRVYKRLCLACTMNHTLCAGILYKGMAGYTRAQTVMILINGFAFELIMLCLTYPQPAAIPLNATSATVAPLVINPVTVVVSGTFAALIVIPAMLSFAWLYEPMIFVRLGQWVLRTAACWPFWLWARCFCRCHCWLWVRCFYRCHPGTTINAPTEGAEAEQRASAPAASNMLCSAQDDKEALQDNHVHPVRDYDMANDRAAAEDDPEREGHRALDNIPGEMRPVAAKRASKVTLSGRGRVRTAATRELEITGRELDEETRADPPQRSYSYESLNGLLLKASLSQSWARKDWPAVRKILLGWHLSLLAFAAMLVTFLLYACEIFEPRDAQPGDIPAGNTDELVLAWFFAAFQRFVLHEPMIILTAKGLPILFASELCANMCGETIVNLLTVIFSALMACIAEIKG